MSYSEFYKHSDNALHYLLFNDNKMVIYFDNKISDHIVIEKSAYNDWNIIPVNIMFKEVTDKHIAKSYDEWLKENNLEDKRNENHKTWYRRNKPVIK